jgi:hypothetical protein
VAPAGPAGPASPSSSSIAEFEKSLSLSVPSFTSFDVIFDAA